MRSTHIIILAVLFSMIIATLVIGDSKEAKESTTCTVTTITDSQGVEQHKKVCSTTTTMVDKEHNYILNSLVGAFLGMFLGPGGAGVGFVAGFIYAML